MNGSLQEAVKSAQIGREDTKSGGRYVLSAGGMDAEMTFSRVNAHLIIIDHTDVPDGLRGTGAGQRLAANAVEDARKGGWKIMPLCPFMRARAMKHREWADAMSM